MIESVEIENLRGIAKGKLDGLTPLVIIVGPNNAGKSTILDAILLAASPHAGVAFSRVLERRSVLDPTGWLVRRRAGDLASEGSAKVAECSGTERLLRLIAIRQDANSETTLRWSSEHLGTAAGRNRPREVLDPPRTPRPLLDSPPLQTVPDARIIEPDERGNRRPLHVLYSRAVERGARRDAKALIKELIPTLEDIEILTQRDQPVLNLVFADGVAHPVELAGDGVRLLMAMTFELATPSGGIVLLEEPETHLHPGAIRLSAQAMLAAMRRGVQIILSTHSLDMIDTLFAAAKEEEVDKISVYRVRLDAGILKTHRLSGSDALRARTEIQDDLR